MSALHPELQGALAQLLQGLNSADNDLRSKYEDSLANEWQAQKPDALLMGLVEHAHAAQDEKMRSSAAVIFRRVASKARKDPTTGENKELFLTLSNDAKVPIRTGLLQCLASEQISHVRNKIGDAIAEIARQYTDNGETWPELLSALFQSSQSPDPAVREVAFRIFATTPGIIERQHENVVQKVFGEAFRDSSVNVKLAGIEAFACFFNSVTKKAQSKYYSLVPEVLNVLPPLKESNDQENLSKAFVSLIELAEAAPKMFKPLFPNLRQFTISVVQDKEMDDQVRQNALELMATFAEFAPNMCKKDASFASDMVTQCLSLMTDIGADDEDAAEWNSQEDIDAEESDLNHVAGEQCMDRLANKLGGEVLLPVTFTWLPRMMHSASWRDRHAALMAISAISEGCRDLMLSELDKVLELVIPALKDPHPRVRFAGCNALGQMSTDFAGDMQAKYHQVVLSNIIPVLESPEPRVQAHAAAALVNFCEEAEKSILEPYLDPLLSHLLVLLNSPKRYVQEQALSTIATIADSAETAFAKYYDALMPQLLTLLRGQQDKEYRLLRAKAMECATLIALAVGKEKMGQQARELVETLATIQTGITDSDDPQAQYLLHCWGRMCRVLGTDFAPYLDGVMHPLLQLASAKADIQLLEDSDDLPDQEDGWELVPLKGKVIGIKTQTLEDKNTAIELITIYAQILEAHFAKYVEEIMDKVALPGLAFFFHDPVRVSSAKLIPALLASYKKQFGDRSEQLARLWAVTVEKEIEILVAEPAIETLAEMYQCFYESVEVIGKGCLSVDHMNKFIESTKSTLKEYEDRVRQREADKADAAVDGEDEDDSMSMQYAIEDDQTLLSDMNKAFHTIFKNMGPQFLPPWERLMDFYDRFINSNDPTQRQWAICIMDDVFEFCGPQSFQYSNHIVQPFINGLQDTNAANRQAATYGVGMAAQKGGNDWAEFVAGCLELLFAVTRMPNSRIDDEVFATENACASIAKILHFNSSKVPNPNAVVDPWLDTLPIVNDEEAAPYAYSFVAQLIDQNHEAVRNKAQQVFHAICLALEAETIQGQTAQKVASSAKVLATTSGVDANQILSSLSPEGQATVQSFFA
ncbi:importin subunit beta-3 [Lithohypha guttulata]|nr:importin subunit beta-3 [Lithohypha guttulata]